MNEARVWDVIEKPKARHTDRQTSWDAAGSISDQSVSVMKQRILQLLEIPGTDQELIARFDMCLFEGSPSGIRSRRAELEKEGLVQVVGQSKTASGRKCSVFQITTHPPRLGTLPSGS